MSLCCKVIKSELLYCKVIKSWVIVLQGQRICAIMLQGDEHLDDGTTRSYKNLHLTSKCYKVIKFLPDLCEVKSFRPPLPGPQALNFRFSVFSQFFLRLSGFAVFGTQVPQYPPPTPPPQIGVVASVKMK